MTRKIFLSIITVCIAISSGMAVTREEMEQARTITAQAFLRYMNDNSDYLDKLNPSRVSELKRHLKQKEIENIKIFESVTYPKIDIYKNWDKSQLLEFWGTTFFADNKVPQKAQGAKSIVKSKINAMNVKQSEAQETTETDSQQRQQEIDAAQEAQRITDSITRADSIAAEAAILEASNETVQEDFAFDTAVTDESLVEEEPVKSKSSPTLIYSLILGILVVIIVVLVVYAAKGIHKSDKQTAKENDSDNTNASEEGNIRDINQEVIDEKELEIASLKAEIDRLNNVILRMNDRLSDAISEISPTHRPKRTIYLAYANSKNVFVRADSVYNEDYSIFKLVTSDGITGTFSIIENPIANKLALSLPISILKNSCQSEDMHHDNWCKQIITENPGTAIFENGRWIVKRKADVNFQ